MAYLCTKFEDYIFTRSNDMKEDAMGKNRTMSSAGHTTCYSPFIETMCLSCTVLEIRRVIFKSRKSFGCHIYLEPQMGLSIGRSPRRLASEN